VGTGGLDLSVDSSREWSGELPVRASGLPRACGALGEYDPDRVELIARGLGDGLTAEHRSETSMLVVDRPPLRWDGPDGRGLAWSQPLTPARAPRSWQDAAQVAGACGLAFEGDRTLVHCDVAGSGSVYFMSSGRAVYFATRIDPLVWAAPEPLHPNWDAWAGILAMNLPIGDRTPFAEIRRLGPFTTLAAGPAGAELRPERWPWAEQEATHTIEAGVPDVVDAMRATVGRLPAGPVTIPLTGGWDSRALLCLLRNDPRRPPRCATTSRELGTWHEEDLAAAVAQTAGVPHEIVEPDPELWWEDIQRHDLLADYQFVARPWAVVLARHLTGWEERPVLDGFGLDTFSQPGNRYITEEVVTAPSGREAGLAMWQSLKETYARPPLMPYHPALRRVLWASCEAQMVEATERIGGSPSRGILSLYITRGLKGVSLLHNSVLGADLPMVTPFTTDEVARACLAIYPKAKLGVGIHHALLRALDPELAVLPSTNDGLPPKRRGRPLRQNTPQALEAVRRSLESGPLAPLLRPETWESFDQGTLPNGAMRVLMFHLWEERYRERLAGCDPVEGFGVPRRNAFV
jgi:hypothetical protein